MPRYEYKCPKCEHQATLIRKVEDRDKTFKCVCGGTPERQVSQTAPPKFEGEGFTPKFHE